VQNEIIFVVLSATFWGITRNLNLTSVVKDLLSVVNHSVRTACNTCPAISDGWSNHVT